MIKSKKKPCQCGSLLLCYRTVYPARTLRDYALETYYQIHSQKHGESVLHSKRDRSTKWSLRELMEQPFRRLGGASGLIGYPRNIHLLTGKALEDEPNGEKRSSGHLHHWMKGIQYSRNMRTLPLRWHRKHWWKRSQYWVTWSWLFSMGPSVNTMVQNSTPWQLWRG